MSLLDKINHQKRKLRGCEIHVTTPEGKTFKEQILSDGSILTSESHKSRGYGFVVDTKPDFQVAQVLPGLCMGSQDVAQDTKLLAINQITHVLSLGVKVDTVPSIVYRYEEVLDTPEYCLQSILEPCFMFIDEGRRRGCVFVHCNAGVSRSAALVIAYLMKQGLSFKEAHSHLKKARSVIKPNSGFVAQLLMYEGMLKDKTE
uniref:Dual specificity protein phosphatase 19 n=1 Tax=Timema cristinae TaxID=61476 RepID=A0A7R9GR43_TIMCR|nr:unnamed protein product [Timema cristinae]